MKAAVWLTLPLLVLLAAPAAAQAPPAFTPPAFTPFVPPSTFPGVVVVPQGSAAPGWLPQATADLRALDKVTARTAAVTGRLGDTLRFGSLSVVVRQCLVRPPDRASDAAAWVEITDSNGGPGFRGWMLASAPSLSMLEHPVYDVRIAGCRP